MSGVIVVVMDQGLPGAAWWRIVAKARLWCEDSACGIKGENPNIRLGRWVSLNFNETSGQLLRQARRLWEVFGQRQDEVAFIPQSGLYALAEPKCDETREDLARTRPAGLLGRTLMLGLGIWCRRISVTPEASAFMRPGASGRSLASGRRRWRDSVQGSGP